MDSPFRFEYLDAERLLPVLVRKAACRALTIICVECWPRLMCACCVRERRRNHLSVRANAPGNSYCAPTYVVVQTDKSDANVKKIDRGRALGELTNVDARHIKGATRPVPFTRASKSD